MGDVINFAAIVQARRVAAAIEQQEQARSKLANERRASLHDKAERAGAGVAGHIMAEAMANIADANEERERANRFTPAYCDPANEVQGSKYQATKDLPVKEVAKRVRDDIKALGLPAALKISVRSDYNSIDVRVKALPADFPVLSVKAASWRKQFGETRDYPFAWVEASSDELRNLLAKLSAILASYNRDNSDSMSDYFDNRFYGSAELDWQVRRKHEAREVEASAGDYWANDYH
ncbi:hypothetical protein [Sphingomonas panaciterrae]|uniref:hypothetical protein n=1 Tax=Sphingomonas panaciterrae TaxID=1462999 RepID=UPI002FF037FE